MSAKDFSDTNPMDFYEAAIGERNQNYYLSKFENFDAQGPGLHVSWNWAAFFFTGFWALYRKMYGWFFAWWFIATVGAMFGKVPNSQIQAVVSLITLASWLGFSAYANSLYHHKIKKRIAATQKANSDVSGVRKFSASGGAYAPTTPPDNNAYAAALAEMEEGRLDKGVWARSFAESGGDESKAKAAYIKARAETFQNADVAVGAIKQDTASHPTTKSITSGVNIWVPIALGGLTLLGVVAAIVLPAYQDYTKRQTASAPVPVAQGKSEPGPFSAAIEQYQGLTLGMSMDDVIRVKGQPSHVLKEADTPAPAPGCEGFKKVISRNDLNGSISNYVDWQYENAENNTRIDVSFSKQAKLLATIGCYTKLTGKCGGFGVSTGMSTADIQSRLGKPEHENNCDATLIWDYESRNISIYFSENSAYMIEIKIHD